MSITAGSEKRRSRSESLEIPKPSPEAIQSLAELFQSWTEEDLANPPTPEEERAYDELMAALNRDGGEMVELSLTLSDPAKGRPMSTPRRSDVPLPAPEDLVIEPPSEDAVKATVAMLESWIAEDSANPPTPEEDRVYDELMVELTWGTTRPMRRSPMTESSVLAEVDAATEPEIERWDTIKLLESWLNDDGESIESARKNLLELMQALDDDRKVK